MTVPSGAEVGGAQDEAGDQRGPARLVAAAGAPAGVTVEVVMEGQQVAPVPVGLEEAWRRRRPGGAVPTRIVIAVGATSTGQLENRAARALADQLGTRVVEFPGDHGGYRALPEQFSRLLDQVLTQSA